MADNTQYYKVSRDYIEQEVGELSDKEWQRMKEKLGEQGHEQILGVARDIVRLDVHINPDAAN